MDFWYFLLNKFFISDMEEEEIGLLIETEDEEEGEVLEIVVA